MTSHISCNKTTTTRYHFYDYQRLNRAGEVSFQKTDLLPLSFLVFLKESQFSVTFWSFFNLIRKKEINIYVYFYDDIIFTVTAINVNIIKKKLWISAMSSSLKQNHGPIGQLFFLKVKTDQKVLTKYTIIILSCTISLICPLFQTQ